MESLVKATGDLGMTPVPSTVAGTMHDASKLPMVLREAFATGTVRDRSGNPIPLSSNISLDEAITLYNVVLAARATATVEIGFAHGISTLAILQAHRDNDEGIHHVVDPFQANYGDAGLAMAAQAGLTRWLQFHRKFPEEVIPGLPRLQFAFIDSSHLFDNTIAELYLIDKKLQTGGCLALHDTWMPSIQKVIRYILTNRRYEITREFDPAGGSPLHASWRQRLKTLIVMFARRIPATDRLLREELLRPWSLFGLRNLVVLRKLEDDDRPWTFHAPF